MGHMSRNSDLTAIDEIIIEGTKEEKKIVGCLISWSEFDEQCISIISVLKAREE
ncbi:hypothetical protein HMPREF9999_01644 [Alloprevotella sp. oral taxon 473 str. F0040]|nr:hypothetical protein HMPREF9999_01644 [Alloprevotella sp. oral taxon 473 str. F0040]